MTAASVMLDARCTFLERAEPTPLWFAYMEREKIDTVALAHYASIVVALTNCRFLGARRFEFGSPADPMAAVVEMHGEDGESVEDLCAWPIKQPGAFASLLGRCPVLGLSALRNPASWFGGQHLRAWRTPLEYLQARATGFCLIEPRHAAFAFTKVAGDIRADDAAHCFALWRASRLAKGTFVHPREGSAA